MHINRILFIDLLGGIGDVLIALSAIQALGRSYPEAQLTVLTFAPGCELLQGDPLIHQVINVERGAVRQQVEAFLSCNHFDLIVSDTNYDGLDQVIQSQESSRVVTNLWRTPPNHERVGERFTQILLDEGLIQPETIAPPQLQLRSSEQLWAQSILAHASHPIVVLYPEAGMVIKRWPTANFVSFGQRLQQRYDATVIVPIGAEPEQAAEIVEAIGGRAQVWPRGTLRQLAVAMAQADLVVAADTGPARIAAALAVPTITLFGPSWHERYGQPHPHINLQGHPECSERIISNFTSQSCWYSGVCPLGSWSTCLEAIPITDVLAAAEPLLNAYAVKSYVEGALG